ncbi:MAG: SWIM zinc finger family protein, partial [Burkholderiales bacterium]|nr:SWIM zinc finger family protein [Burkholderiales bacterium]
MSAQPSLPAYDQPQIVRWLGASTVDKGRAYVGSVSALTWDVDLLSGEVYGTRRDPYDVDVFFYPHGQRLEIDGHCTCSVGYDCKHVAAVLMALLEHRQTDAPDRIDPSVRPELVSWLEAFRRLHGPNGTDRTSGVHGTKKPKPSPHALAYVITRPKYSSHHKVEIFKASLAREGGVRSIGDPWENVEKALLKPPQFVSDADLSILRLLWLGRSRDVYDGYGGFALQGGNGAAALERMAATGRLFMKDTNGQVPSSLRSADPRPADMQWPLQPDDRVRPVLQTVPPSTAMILTEPPWYVDQVSGEAGAARLPWDVKRVLDYLTMPSVSAAEASIVATVLREVAPEMPTPPTLDPAAMRVLDVEPVPVLHLNTLPVNSSSFVLFTSKGSTQTVLDHATVSFDYDGFRFEPADTSTLMQTASAEVVQVKRRADVEKSRLAELRQAGLVHVKASSVYGPQPFPPAMLGLKDTQGWPEFMHETLPGLRKGGWRVEMAREFRFNVVEIESIDGHLHEAADGWFDLEMGIDVADRHVRLEPLLAELFRRDRRWLAGNLDGIADDEAIELTTDVGERLRLRADRLKPVVRVLIDLFEGLGDSALRVSRLDAGRLEALSDTGRWQFHGDDSLRQLAQRLRGGGGVGEAPIPQGLGAELRAYQHQGLSWMQFLREHDLSGVLADDMGLGKTVQTLAHVLAEKEAGRLDRPTLIVLPTSLVHNWCEEARRF